MGMVPRMSEMSIRRVTIVGAGKTGGALAAHLTNLGFSVALLDLTPNLAAEGLEYARPALYVPERAGEIRIAALEEDLDALQDADWIVEAIPERLDEKRALYAHLAPRIQPDAVVTTCTWSLPLAELTAGTPEGFSARFLGAAFALPLQDHRLAEVRPGPDPALARDFGRFLTDRVARRIVYAPDGPGGVMARYGLWCLFVAAHTAEKLRLEIDDVEAITRGLLDQTNEGVFGAIDRIGVDELRHVSTNLQERLPNDRGARFFNMPNSFVGLLARGWNGDRAGRGFYRREGRERLALSFSTMVYRPFRDSTLPGLRSGDPMASFERLRTSLNNRDEVGEYLREFLLTSLRYAEYLATTLDVSILDFDRTMEWGFGWAKGPFALLDGLGMGAARYYQGQTFRNSSGAYEPIHDDVVCPRMEDCPVVDRQEGYTIHDLEDGVEAVALAGGVLTPSRVEALIDLFERPMLDGFILTAEERDFPTLDVEFVSAAFRRLDLVAVESYLSSLQELGERLESHRCVAAIPGRCVGPSLGLALSCSAIVAVADAEIGFNEGRLGLIPTARGLSLMRAMHGGSPRKLGDVVVSLAEGVVATNADLARGLGYLRPIDVTEHLPERLLTTAKSLVGEVAPTPRRVLPIVEGPLMGIIDRGLAERRARGGLTDHDVAVGHRIRQVVVRASTYEEALDRERGEFVSLGSNALTQARLRHFIETGRPLRN